MTATLSTVAAHAASPPSFSTAPTPIVHPVKILLVNPNRYRHPPVIPIGLEYLLAAVKRAGHEAMVLDLCFAGNPAAALTDTLEAYRPGITGITVRQIDTCLYRDNRFFLSDIRDLVTVCRATGTPVVLGGAGFSIMPEEVMAYTGAGYGIRGPGEWALVELLEGLGGGASMPAILDGYSSAPRTAFEPGRETFGDYEPYLVEQGIAGFRTQLGCRGSCFFCTESAKPLLFHAPDSVGREVAALVRDGCDRFHLCDSEFNQELPHCIAVCDAIHRHTGGVDWSLYMKPAPVSAALFDALARSGATMITVSIDTLTHGPDTYGRLRTFFATADERGIRTMVDLSVGYPHESRERTSALLDLLASRPAGTVGVNSFYRIYPGTRLCDQIAGDPSLAPCVLGRPAGTDLIHPLFFRWFTEEEVDEMTAGRNAFRIEGRDKATNYQRAERLPPG